MKILLHPNYEKQGSVDCTLQTIEKLRDCGLVPLLDEQHRQITGNPAGCEFGAYDDLLRACDIVMTIGGDGTILNALQYALEADKPLLGVNTGRVGFLAQLESDELDKLELLASGKFTRMRRMMIEMCLQTQEGLTRHTALNDVVISRAGSERIVEMEVYCKQGQVAVHRADGIIFSSPTGSTAYSLSAGGPIAAPGLELILMTAICPHASFNRSMVLSPERDYAVRELPGNNQCGLSVSVDGQRVGTVRLGDTMVVSRSKRYATLIDLNLQDFYARVDQKLSFRR